MNMMATITAQGPQTMSSLEIAERTRKNHADVMRDIRVQIGELMGEGGLSKFADTYRHPQNGQSYPCYRLPKRECLILVSGYSVTLRAAIVDRWAELEAQVAALRPALPDFTNPAIAARAWADEVMAAGSPKSLSTRE